MTLVALLWLGVRGDGLRMVIRTRPLRPVAALLILGGTLAMSLSVYLTYNLTFVQHQGRYLFPARCLL